MAPARRSHVSPRAVRSSSLLVTTVFDIALPEAALQAPSPREVTARTLWPGESPLGNRLLVGEEAGTCAEDVGVVEDSRRFQIVSEAAAFNVSRPLGGDGLGAASTLLVRVSGDPAEAAAEIRRTLAALAPRVRFIQIDPLEEILAPQFRS